MNALDYASRTQYELIISITDSSDSSTEVTVVIYLNEVGGDLASVPPFYLITTSDSELDLLPEGDGSLLLKLFLFIGDE